MKFVFSLLIVLGILLSEISSEDCEQFKNECNELCLDRTDGVWTSECWGDPLYVECKCSDESTHQIPGFICKNSECPPIFNPKTRPKLTRTRTRGPIQRKPAEKPDCGVFKQECKDYCLGKSGGVHISECWGSPLYAHCKCSDDTVYNIEGFVCKNEECPVDDSGFLNRE